MCLTVEYVEGHDPNPSCFVMFRFIATGHDLSVLINGTSMCVHLSPQVYTIVATDTEDEINTTAPAVIISNVTVPSYSQTSSSIVFSSTEQMPSSTVLQATATVVIPKGMLTRLTARGTLKHNYSTLLYRICCYYHKCSEILSAYSSNHHFGW